MKRQLTLLITSLMTFTLLSTVSFSEEITKDFMSVPVKGHVTMIDLGAHTCIPCKMMAPIIAKLEKAYKGKADIVFIDVWKHNDQAKRFNIRGIPTQIFFDENGNEMYRHTGYMDEASITKQLSKLGVPVPAKNKS